MQAPASKECMRRTRQRSTTVPASGLPSSAQHMSVGAHTEHVRAGLLMEVVRFDSEGGYAERQQFLRLHRNRALGFLKDPLR